MTTNHAGYVVVLERDKREDDAAESILVALRMIKGVVSVKPVEVDAATIIAEERAATKYRKKFYDFLDHLD